MPLFRTVYAVKVFAAALLLPLMLGCNQNLYDPLHPPGIAPHTAQGLSSPAAPGPPVPVTERDPFGLYAQQPSADTLARLATGMLSPDRRFRAVVTAQGAWVTRVDGAWLWQIPVGTEGVLIWTPRATLLMRDRSGNWLEVDPYLLQVAQLSEPPTAGNHQQ